jgi:hypothetical protein
MPDEEISQILKSVQIDGRIIDVISVSVYQDKTYEQNIIFQLENGLNLVISDVDMQCKKENIGEKKNIQISNSLRSNIERCGNNKIGIFPYGLDQGPEADICGILEQIIEPSEEKYKKYRRYAILNIGFGLLWIVIRKNHKEDFTLFQKGDCVFITGGRLDLKKIS